MKKLINQSGTKDISCYRQVLINVVQNQFNDDFGIKKEYIQSSGYYICNNKTITIKKYDYNINNIQIMLDQLSAATAFIRYYPKLYVVTYNILNANKIILFTSLNLSTDELNDFYASFNPYKIINLHTLFFNILKQSKIKKTEVSINKIFINITTTNILLNYIIMPNIIYTWNMKIHMLYESENFLQFISNIYTKSMMPLLTILDNIIILKNIIKQLDINIHIISYHNVPKLIKLIKLYKQHSFNNIKYITINQKLQYSFENFIDIILKNKLTINKIIKIGNNGTVEINMKNMRFSKNVCDFRYYIGPFIVNQYKLLQFWTMLNEYENIIIDINKILISI